MIKASGPPNAMGPRPRATGPSRPMRKSTLFMNHVTSDVMVASIIKLVTVTLAWHQ